MRKRGYEAQSVERPWNRHSKVTQDLFGFIDIVAVGQCQIIGVQTTSGTNVSHRLEKIRQEPRVRAWLRAGGCVEVHGWRLVGPKGKRKTYRCRIVRVWLDGEALMTDEDEEGGANAE